MDHSRRQLCSIPSLHLEALEDSEGATPQCHGYGEGEHNADKSSRTQLQNLHSFKFSGLCNEKTLDISPQASGRGVTLTARTKSATHRSVANGLASKNIKGRGGRKVAGAVSRQSGSDVGRLDIRNVRQRLPRCVATFSVRSEN